MSLRCSALPKLAVCSSFEGKRGPAGPAALRGTTVDYEWRKAIFEMVGSDEEFDAWDNSEAPSELNADDLASMQWGINAATDIAGGALIETRASKLKVDIPHTGSTGEMDGLIEGKRITFDLKTGMIRNYREQMAGYALGMMARTFTDDWTCYLIFCDQQEVVRHEFTHDEAFDIVKNIAAAYHTDEKQPTPNEYCGWCQHANTCDARLIAANKTFGQTARLIAGEDFDEILGDEEALAEFLDGASVIGDYQAQGKTRAKEIGGINGWKTVKFKGREFVDKKALPGFIKKNGLDLADVLGYCAALPANKLRELAGEKADEIISRGKEVIQLRKTKKDK
ncbi:MAG: DUF2800 domain-containing protein [Myxococcales bacterium]|nr:DUF2800 domain-containing protein [Myxococcales bacterium]